MKRLSFIHPNIITIVGIIPPVLFFIFIIAKFYPLALLIFLGNAVDMLDGAFARMHGKVTAFGSFFDATMDRISDALCITAFGFGGLARWELVVVLLTVSYLISYTRSRGELVSQGHVTFKVGLIERPQRLITIFFALLLYLFFPSTVLGNYNIIESIFLLLIFLSLYTFFQRVFLAYTRLKN